MATGDTDYGLGVVRDVMPAPLIPEHCREVPAGPLRFVVESRFLPDDIAHLSTVGDRPDLAQKPVLDDGGGSVHVFGAADGLEHLRFDCFESYPHYHYIRNREQQNVIVRYDEIADGDPILWTTERLRHRLPQMLEFAGADTLAQAVRADADSVAGAVDAVGHLMEEARRRDRARRDAATGV